MRRSQSGTAVEGDCVRRRGCNTISVAARIDTVSLTSFCD